MKRSLIITIDTEGDNLWAVADIRKEISTHNADYLFRFQELCEEHHLIPTYLTNYEMANSDAMLELGRMGLKKKSLEIGAHEHAWNQPPYYPLIRRPGKRGKPYLSEYPRRIIRQKLEYLTHTLEDQFQCRITSHRGGRWCLNSVIVEELERLGYETDCTCTPGIDWRGTPGWSAGAKGTNWSHSSSEDFYLFNNSKKKYSSILEVPVSIIDMKKSGHYSWLRPNLNNIKEMMCLLDWIRDEGMVRAEFMLHSSELMPGGSPIFNNKGKIEKLYRDLDNLFSYAEELGFDGMSLSEYARRRQFYKNE